MCSRDCLRLTTIPKALGGKACLKGEAEEAAFPSDKLFNMTPRLRRITAEIDIPLERPRSYALKASETFFCRKKQALTLIREKAIKATQYQE